MIDRLQALQLIPVVALERAADAEPLADALCAGGLPCAEITLRTEAALDSLSDKGLIYEGVLEPPKGKKPEDWEPREQTLFKSTEHGDDVDRPVKKSDGAWTYFAPDIADCLNQR